MMSSKRTPSTTPGKVKARPNGNGNIMNFFKKADSSVTSEGGNKNEEESLFLEEGPVKTIGKAPVQTPTPPRDENLPDEINFVRDDSPVSRFNEDSVPFKRRKTNETDITASETAVGKIQGARRTGPFADDSDEDEDLSVISKPILQANDHGLTEEYDKVRMTTPPSENRPKNEDPPDLPIPRLKREATSIGERNTFEDADDFIDDEFPEEGEEYMERRWMEMQAEMEMGLEDEDLGTTNGPDKHREEAGGLEPVVSNDVEFRSCPICGGSTTGLAEQASGFN